MMNTREVARYLGIHEKQVYALVKDKRIPSTRLTGKWIFPKRLIDEWIESNARNGLEQARQKSRHFEGALLAAGSNDPILDLLLSALREYFPALYLFSASSGSTEGLRALKQGYTDIAWSHLFDPESEEYNIPFIATHLSGIQPVVLNLFYRDIGFIVAPDNPLGIRGFEDLTREGIQFVNRQKGSGTRILLDYHLNRLQIPPSRIQGYGRETCTHLEVGLSILSKEADAGIATIAIAKLFDLGFIPITRERFDMVIHQSTFFNKGVQAFIELLNTESSRSRFVKLGNYDFRNAGKIIYP